MQVIVNGEQKEIPDGLTVSGLLRHLGIHPGRVAVERNLEILLRAKWDEMRVQSGDRYEIVNFVGGG
ncbi:MAG: sulfur carrier protein ThiS [Acidobacteria bacterium]|nr:sulfur carrier protein ThiS [Acidobacteriota bacterium]MCL5286818.1 sulfur carrier protein ThiS [Acidobacteriota bacterium]